MDYFNFFLSACYLIDRYQEKFDAMVTLTCFPLGEGVGLVGFMNFLPIRLSDFASIS